MHVVVTGATGNVGTSVIDALVAEPRVDTILAVARRVSTHRTSSKVTWSAVDLTDDRLEPLVDGADAVVHLAWELQPSWDEEQLVVINVVGTHRLLDAIEAARVPSLVYASSVGAYAPGPVDQRVDESWPTTGIPTSQYSRHKVAVERLLDGFERRAAAVRVVRLRKALVFKSEAATAIAHLFLGPLVPARLLGRVGLPVIPRDPRFTLQAVHADDAAEAYRLALIGDEHGAFNIAAEPVLEPHVLAEELGARTIPVPVAALRLAAHLSHRLRLQVSEPGWIDLAVQSPVLDTEKARDLLGWSPRYSSREALRTLLEGFATGATGPTPRLRDGPVAVPRA